MEKSGEYFKDKRRIRLCPDPEEEAAADFTAAVEAEASTEEAAEAVDLAARTDPADRIIIIGGDRVGLAAVVSAD